ncbi:cytochrome P450 [Colletotrichum zoysiae]|uniref:Cytochrome P450 n=1 Tax=Colletotrichum zoysiae TaxID=1216348 RepID=A0AAD9HF79_9PEZI|nr:cytochrome P450 [Colletotrichum zoysiae]
MIRKIFHQALHISAARGYVPYQDLESKQMLTGLLDEPNRFTDHIRRYTNSLTTQIVFGFRIAGIHDEKLKKLYYCIERWSEVMASSAAALLEAYPVLRSLGPLSPGKRYAEKLQKETDALYLGHWMDAKKRVVEGTSNPCFCISIAENQKALGFSDVLAGYISGSALEAGSDTTANTLHGFVQAMLLYPSVQEQAREELDRVCGTERLPRLGLLALHTGMRQGNPAVAANGNRRDAHAVIKDDEYMGYTIPKGAGVMINVWAIHTDEERWEDPRAFDPSRYAGDDQTSFESASNADPSKRDHYGFGAGRRLCQGTHVAERSLFLGIARLLWAFRFERAVDGRGAEVVPDADDVTDGVLVQPRPFPARITARGEAHARIVRKEWEAAQELLEGDDQWKEIPRGMAFESLMSSNGKD